MKDTHLKGSGVLLEEKRDLPEFSGIELTGAYDVVVRCGRPQEVLVSGDDNIVPLVKTEVSRNALKVILKQSVSTKHKIKLTISVATVDSLLITGAANVDISGVNGKSFDLEIPGAGDVKVEGACDALNISLQGAGNVNAKQLIAKTAAVTINGAGNAVLSVSDELKVTIRGVGNVGFYGNPSIVKKTISGIGRVHKR